MTELFQSKLSGDVADYRPRLCIRRSPFQPVAASPMNVARLVLPCTVQEGIAQQCRENDRLEGRLDDRIVITITFAACALPGSD
jgi:hypothetical protein